MFQLLKLYFSVAFTTEGFDVCLYCVIPQTTRKMIPAFGSPTSLVGTFRAGSVFSAEGTSSLPVSLYAVFDGGDAESVKIFRIQKLPYIFLDKLFTSSIPQTL